MDRGSPLPLFAWEKGGPGAPRSWSRDDDSDRGSPLPLFVWKKGRPGAPRSRSRRKVFWGHT